jgi:hypothetical protein
MKSIKEKATRFKPLQLYKKDEIKNRKNQVIAFGNM